MKIKKLMPMDAESRRLTDWMEKGVYDALQKKYLKTLLFSVCETIEGPIIEEHAFSFSYSNSESQDVSMNVNRIRDRRHGGAFECNSSIQLTPNQMRSSACKMVLTLIELMKTLDKMPEEGTILMKLLYYDDVTPVDYEPPFFRGCTEEEVNDPWTKNPLKMEGGNVNSKYLVLSLEVKSLLDLREDENDDVCLGAVSVKGDTIDEGQYVVAPPDDTQDPVVDEEQLRRIKEWIISYHLCTVELTDVLSNFSDISVVIIEEVMDKLVKEDTLTKSGTNTYIINKLKKNGEFEAVSLTYAERYNCALSGDFLELDDLADPLSLEGWFDLADPLFALSGDFLELDDLANPLSLEEWFDLADPLSSEEWYDLNMLLQELEDHRTVKTK